MGSIQCEETMYEHSGSDVCLEGGSKLLDEEDEFISNRKFCKACQ